jgi:hypothetical protein
MSTNNKRTASPDEILRRLQARSEMLDRQLEHVLRSAGHDAGAFVSDDITTQLAADPRRVEVEAALLPNLEQGGESWEELSKPSLDQLNLDPRVRLLRV